MFLVLLSHSIKIPGECLKLEHERLSIHFFKSVMEWSFSYSTLWTTDEHEGQGEAVPVQGEAVPVQGEAVPVQAMKALIIQLCTRWE